MMPTSSQTETRSSPVGYVVPVQMVRAILQIGLDPEHLLLIQMFQGCDL